MMEGVLLDFTKEQKNIQNIVSGSRLIIKKINTISVKKYSFCPLLFVIYNKMCIFAYLFVQLLEYCKQLNC